MDDSLKEYRTELIKTVPKLNENYNKLIVTLSGGALALSIAFLKDILKQEEIRSCLFIILAWLALIVSLASVLGSLLFGIEAHKKAIDQVDKDLIYSNTPGGIFTKITDILHYSGAVFLVIGLVLIAIFVCNNMGVKNAKASKANPTETTIKADAKTTKSDATRSRGR